MAKIHENLITAICLCLEDIFFKDFYADKVIEYRFKQNRKWGSRDRKFIAEAVYEIVRNWRYLWFLSGKEVSDKQSDILNIFAVWWYVTKKDDQFLFDKDVVDKRLKEEVSPALKESYPDDLYERALSELGEDWHTIAKALNEVTHLFLRTNTLKIKRKELLDALALEDFEDATFVRDNEEGIIIPSRKNVFRSKAFKAGYFEVQDIASQFVAPQLAVEPGMRVIDACAGAGGKTLHLASLMQNKGRIIALDIHEKKLHDLKIRARRAGVSIVEPKLIEGSKTIKRLHDTADALLLDVPCSGLGVIRRNPDSKWKLSLERITELQAIQADILNKYSKMLKVGGRMVYATCSLLPSENEEQIKTFLAEHQDFSMLAEKTLRPDIEGYDGFYFAVMQRN